MLRSGVLLAACALSTAALASPRIDVYTADFQYISTIDPGGAPGDLVQDIEFGANGDMWVLLVGSSHSINTCNPNDVIKRFNSAGVLQATYKAGLRFQQGFAINPAGGYWVSGIPDCGSLSGGRVYGVDGNDQVVWSSQNYSNGLSGLEQVANGDLITATTANIITVDPTTGSQQSFTSYDPYRYRRMVTDSVTGNTIGVASNTQNSSAIQRLQVFGNSGQGISGIPFNGTGVTRPWEAISHLNGELTAFETGSNNQTPYVTLASDFLSVVDSGTLTTSRSSARVFATDAAGLVYVGSWGADPIENVSASVTPNVISQQSTMEVTFSYDSVLPADAYIQVEFDHGASGGFDVSNVMGSDASWVSGADGSLSYVPDPYGYYYYEGQRLKVGFLRSGGTDIPANTLLTLDLSGLINPSEPTSIGLSAITVAEDEFGILVASVRSELPSLAIVGGLSCDIGSPFDWNQDGEPEICVGMNVVLEDGAVIAPFTQIGDDAFVGRGANLGGSSIIHAGSVIAPLAQVGEDAVIGANSVISRGAIVHARAEIGPDSVIGRLATIGSDSVLPSSSIVSYRAVVGQHVEVDTGLLLGSLSVLGGDASNPGAVDCVGPLTIGRASQVSADPDYSLTCLGSAVIGPDVIMSSGAVLGDNTRFRKQSTIGGSLTTGTDASIGRQANFGTGVTVQADTRVGTAVQLCDGTTVSGRVASRYIDPTCP